VQYVVEALQEAVLNQIALDTNISVDQVRARLENDGTLVVPNAARRYQDPMRELWEVLKDGFTDTPEYWIVKNWVHRWYTNRRLGFYFSDRYAEAAYPRSRAAREVLDSQTIMRIARNTVRDGRYGLHFMYSDGNRIEDNHLEGNSVGAFLMYSRRVTMRSNTFASNRGPSGYGIGLKDMDDTIIVDNIIINNRVGVHLDTSPREIDSIGEFSGNVFAFNDIGVELMPSVRRNMFSSNSFIENEEQVAVAGGGTLKENSWTVNDVGNFWSDYAGFDADGDGQGDIAYKSERLFENLMQQEPVLRLFLYSPASTALDFAARAFPLVKPQPKLEDERPKMTPTIPNAPSLPVADNSGLIWLAVGLLLTSVGIIALPRLSQYRYDIKV